MKKILIYSIFIILIVIIFKYVFSNYKMEYKVSDYNVKMTYKNSRFYYEISNDEYTYNFDYYKRRDFTKTKIKKIVDIKEENLDCIYPVIDDVETYPLCYKDNEYIDYNLIDSSLLEEYKEEDVEIDKTSKDFVYFNNLSKDEYVALWNYKGYIVMNGSSYKNVEMFNSDRYDNTLSILIDNNIYMANYDEEHEYNSLIKFNIESLKTEKIELKTNIDYDSYIVGNIKNNLYIYDDKYSILYEINLKNSKVNIKGNNENGFVKYENDKFVPCSKSAYKVDKIKINNSKSNYSYRIKDGVFKIINDNNKIEQKILNDEIIISNEYNNRVYYMNKDNFYIYDPYKGSKKVFYNYELTFNDTNSIYVYINN